MESLRACGTLRLCSFNSPWEDAWSSWKDFIWICGPMYICAERGLWHISKALLRIRFLTPLQPAWRAKARPLSKIKMGKQSAVLITKAWLWESVQCPSASRHIFEDLIMVEPWTCLSNWGLSFFRSSSLKFWLPNTILNFFSIIVSVWFLSSVKELSETA